MRGFLEVPATSERRSRKHSPAIFLAHYEVWYARDIPALEHELARDCDGWGANPAL